MYATVTVMIQFSVQGAYLLLLVQGRTLNGEGVLIRDGLLISLLAKTAECEKHFTSKVLCSYMEIIIERHNTTLLLCKNGL